MSRVKPKLIDLVLDDPPTSKGSMNTILHFLKGLALGVLLFAIEMVVICLLIQAGLNAGWGHNSIFNAAVHGGVMGAAAGAYWAQKELLKR